MFRLQRPPAIDLPDLPGFVALVNRHSDLFDAHQPVVVGRAPGRLDVMGGIADYSGALVLELPLACATYAAVQLVADPTIIVRSIPPEADTPAAEVRLALGELAPGGAAISEPAAHTRLTANPADAWAAYVLGPLLMLARAHSLTLTQGVRILVASNVPPGKGVSSSAALEVAVLQAFAAALPVALPGRELALLCQGAENLVVGAPCGVMDQMTVACGVAGQLLALRCQPAELEPAVPLPEGLAVWGIDSGIRHAVGGSDYGAVRVGAFIGYRILAELAGLDVQPAAAGKVTINDTRWGGYLANLTPSEWQHHYANRIPDTISGATFLERYGGISDTITRVDPARQYAVHAPTAHPIWEHHRVRLFRALLEAGAKREEDRQLLGELMYQSHASYSHCGLGSSGTDQLVELARRAGPAAGIYGAKITGGGSGGTVAVLARQGSAAQIEQLAEQYTTQSGDTAQVLGGSSAGAVAYGVALLAGL